MAYLIDKGCAHPDHLNQAHSVVQERERERFQRMTGTIGFDDDEQIPALQAADLIAWTSRKKQNGEPLSDEFEPLEDVLSRRKPAHSHISIPSDGIENWARPIRKWLKENGTLPSMIDLSKMAV